MMNQESLRLVEFSPKGIRSLEPSRNVKSIEDWRIISDSAGGLLIEETKQCVTCGSTIKEQETVYLKWQKSYFCDTICLDWYQKQNLSKSCANCFSVIPTDVFGNLIFRFDSLLQFCSILCFQAYRICVYCMGKLSFSIEVKKHNFQYCSQECFIKYRKAQGASSTALPELDRICSICKSDLHPINIHCQSGEDIKSICNQFCLQTYALSLKSTWIMCDSCKMFFLFGFSQPIKVALGKTVYTLCSKKCENHMIFSNLNTSYTCAYCKTLRYDIDLIQRCSTIEPIIYLCNVRCYLNKYTAKIILEDVSLQITEQVTNLSMDKLLESTIETYRTSLSISGGIPKQSKNQEEPTEQIMTYTFTSKGNNTDLRSNNIKDHLIIQPHGTREQKNVAIMTCSIQKADKSIYVRPNVLEKSSQTDLYCPIDAYLIPAPMLMFSIPSPKLVPFVSPMSIPIFMATSKKSSNKIFGDVREIGDHCPSNLLDTDILAVAKVPGRDSYQELENELTLSANKCNDNTISEINNNDSCSKKHSLDANIGVHAWQQWCKFSQASNGIDKSDILSLPASELAVSSLTLFVRDVKKSNGKNFAPDTIFYLCLSIQKYLVENGRVDNIFFDDGYEDFVANLDDHMKTFSVLFIDSQYIVTRVEEEHLWESGQLGATSAHILLNTILYNNMKYFQLLSIEENMTPFRFKIHKAKEKDCHTTLCFYPNKGAQYYKMPSNLADPKRCPVKLLELYYSKLPCIESEHFGQFYFKPKVSTTSDDPVWYSSEHLDQRELETIMNRLKVVKELLIQTSEE